MNPLLSVIIPLHNQAATITTALDCLASQHVPLEIIVIDDASTDDSCVEVEKWSAAHGVPLTLLRNPVRRRALASRLAGLQRATADDIMFMDADDTLVGEDTLADFLTRKHEADCEVAHFRTQVIYPDDPALYDFGIAAPLLYGDLRGLAVFDAYATLTYPPVMTWGKIWSRSLLLRVTPIVEKLTVYRFDDKVLVSLLMLHARSYLGCGEYLYRYNHSADWPVNKFAGRVHDLVLLKKVITPLMDERGISSLTKQNFLNFIDKRITRNMGKLCILTEERLREGHDSDTVFEEISPFLDDEELFSAAMFSTARNVDAVLGIMSRIRNGF